MVVVTSYMEKARGYNMTIEEKNKLIKDRIESLQIHVTALEQDILDNPGSDHPDKPSKESVLEEIKQIIKALKNFEISLTNQG
jgi:hypothetical protein